MNYSGCRVYFSRFLLLFSSCNHFGFGKLCSICIYHELVFLSFCDKLFSFRFCHFIWVCVLRLSVTNRTVTVCICGPIYTAPHCKHLLVIFSINCSSNATNFDKEFLAASHSFLALNSKCHFKFALHADVEWLQILCCAPRSHSRNWVCSLDGFFHRFCYLGPLSVQNEQHCFALGKKNPSPLAAAFWQSVLY